MVRRGEEEGVGDEQKGPGGVYIRGRTSSCFSVVLIRSTIPQNHFLNFVILSYSVGGVKNIIQSWNRTLNKFYIFQYYGNRKTRNPQTLINC